jgi:soluble lytic murein transglycosylase-like protein
LKIPKREEYLFHNGAFILKNPWAIRFRNLIIASLVATAIVPTQMTSAAYVVWNSLTFQKTKEQKMVDYIQSTNKDVSDKDAAKIVLSVIKHSSEFDIPVELMMAIGKVESTYNKFAISSAGALGVFQVMPNWHHNKLKNAKNTIGTPEPFDIEVNAYLGSWIIRDCLDKWKGLSQALLCYNGSNAKPNGYDQKVLAAMKEIKSIL